jgi:hypothetical protein
LAIRRPMHIEHIAQQLIDELQTSIDDADVFL